MDLCQTPGYGVEPLVKGVSGMDYWAIWEPACGEGYMSQALIENWLNVTVATDIEEDFLSDYEPDEYYDAIVTNPPFSLKREFLEQAFKKRRAFRDRDWKNEFFGIAFLMQTEVVSTKWFYELVKKEGEPGIIWFNPRINFKMPEKGWEGSGSHFSTAWFTWGLGFDDNKFLRMDYWNKEYRQQFEY